MWTRKNLKNRRLERQHVLDVKMRSSRLRSMRMRFSAIALGVAFGTLFGLYLLWRAGDWALDHFLYRNPGFAIQTLEVQTDGVIAVDQLCRWAGVRLGDNLLALDLPSVKRHLELVSAIQSVAIERVLPHTLRISVTEREPLAQVFAPQPRRNGPGFDIVLFQLDRDGFAILPLDPRQLSVPPAEALVTLPTLSGVDPADLRPGKRVEAPSVRAALELIDDFEHSGMAGLVELRRIEVISPEALCVTTGQGGEVVFSIHDIERQLRRWREVYEYGRLSNRAIASLDLAVTNNIPARWLDAGAVPPPPPKARKPAPLRKRHV